MPFRLPLTLSRPRPSIPLRSHKGIRTVSSKVHRLPTNDGESQDFRPPRFYTISRALSWTLIPATAIYAIFIYDFGDRDHVFQPARKWAEEQKAAFLTLSSDERQILDGESTKTDK